MDVERMLSERVELLGATDTPSGMQGAKVLTLRSAWRGAAVVFRAKWRLQSSEDLVNEPRKELAAYAVQKLFLDDEQMVVPPTAPHCFPLAEYRRFDREAAPSFHGIDCVLGFASYWLESAETVSSARKHGLLPEGSGIMDHQLFEQDPSYSTSVAHSNLLTYLINHGDAHAEQFLLERTPRGLRAYVVDNSIAFLSAKNPMLVFRQDWSHIQVPRLPRRAIERLSKLTHEDFGRLGTVVELERNARQLRNVSGAVPSPSDGSTMSWNGSRLRIGLTTAEIALVESRVHELLARPNLARMLSD
jgi:hypothetical protein